LVKVLAKRKGIPEDEAKLLLESLKQQDDYEEIKQSLAAIADMGEVVGRFPSTVQPLAFPLFAQAMVGGGSSRAEKIAENVALITAAIKAAYGTDDGAAVKVIEDLRKEIQELKEEQMRREQEAMLQQVEQTFQSVTEYIRALEQKIEQLEGNGRREGDELDALESYLEKVERTKEKLKKLGLVKDREDEADFSKAEEILRKAGYRIEKPLTWDNLERMMEEKLKKIREEARKEAMEELKVEEKRLSMIMDLVSVIAGAAFDAASASGGGQSEGVSKGEELRRRFEEWRQSLQTVQEQE